MEIYCEFHAAMPHECQSVRWLDDNANAATLAQCFEFKYKRKVKK